MSKPKEDRRSELFGVRVTPLDRERIEFLARMAAKSPTSIAALLLSEAARAKMHEISAPPTPDETPALENARSI